jgi:hypothetical protein
VTIDVHWPNIMIPGQLAQESIILVKGHEAGLLAEYFTRALKAAGLWDYLEDGELWAATMAIMTLNEIGLDIE